MSNSQTHNKDLSDFIGLLTEHQSSLRAYIISLMPGLDGTSDALQNTNLILWEKRESFEIGSNFIAWAFSIARYEVKNYSRKLAKLQTQSFIDEELIDHLADHSILSPEETELRAQALESCLSRLSSEQVTLVTERYSAGKTLTAYAQQVGRTPSSMRVTLHRIRAKLRKCVNSKLSLQLHT